MNEKKFKLLFLLLLLFVPISIVKGASCPSGYTLNKAGTKCYKCPSGTKLYDDGACYSSATVKDKYVCNTIGVVSGSSCKYKPNYCSDGEYSSSGTCSLIVSSPQDCSNMGGNYHPANDGAVCTGVKPTRCDKTGSIKVASDGNCYIKATIAKDYSCPNGGKYYGSIRGLYNMCEYTPDSKSPILESGSGSGSGSGSLEPITYKISNATVSSISNQKYSGNAIKPNVTVKYNSTTLKKGTDYTVSYSNNTAIGTATVKITGKGRYTGSKSVNFKIVGVITYKANGGTGSDVTQTVAKGAKINLKGYSTFKKEGYELVGWNEKKDGSGKSWTIANTNKAGVTWTRTKNLTLYAVWQRIKVIYNGNGGTAVNSSGKTYSTWSENVPTNGKYYLKDNFYSKKGYNFVGWNEKKDGTGTDWTAWYAKNYSSTGQKYWQWNYKSYPSSVTLYAIWKKSTYTIRYDANGGTGTMANQTVSYGDSFKLTKGTFTKTNYEFIGWQDPSGIIWDDEYSGKWKYENGTYGISNNVLVLKAIWRDPNSDADVIEGDYISVTTHDTPTKFSKRRGFKNYEVYNKNNQTRDKTSKFKTGDKFDITSKRYTIIVIGDPTGDGESNLGDIIMIYDKMSGKRELDAVAIKAADVNDDSKLDMTDIMRIYNDMVNRR